MMPSIRTRAIILKRINYGEADRIINFLTPFGKISAIAKGVRKEGSRLSGGLELLAVCDVVIHKQSSDLGVLTSARIVDFYKNILNDYQRLEFFYEVIKIINKSSESLTEDSWYNLLARTIKSLDNFKIQLDVIKIWFFLHYSVNMGYGLSLYYDINGQKLMVDESYSYNQLEKGLEIDKIGGLSANHIKLLRLLEKNLVVKVSSIRSGSSLVDDCLLVVRQHASI